MQRHTIPQAVVAADLMRPLIESMLQELLSCQFRAKASPCTDAVNCFRREIPQVCELCDCRWQAHAARVYVQGAGMCILEACSLHDYRRHAQIKGERVHKLEIKRCAYDGASFFHKTTPPRLLRIASLSGSLYSCICNIHPNTNNIKDECL